MFTRILSGMATPLAMPGELSLTFPDLGGASADPFPVIRFSMVNPSEVQTYDFETEEISGVCTIKYLFRGGVMRKQEMTDISISSPILIMQDMRSPIAYLYPDGTGIGYPSQPEGTKSRRQEIQYTQDLRLPVLRARSFDTIVDNPEWVALERFAIKGNWHLLADSVICDTVSVFVRPRVKSWIQLNVVNFL